jgi:hypothetical protein
MFDDREVRYHFPDEVELDPREPVIIQKLVTGTSEFVQVGVAPSDVRDMKAIRAYVRRIALTRGGEAWRAVTERGELLCIFSVYGLAHQLSGRNTIRLNDDDQYHLGVARGWLDLPPPC